MSDYLRGGLYRPIRLVMISWVFAFLSYPLTMLIFVASMVVAVVLGAVLEVRTPQRHRIRNNRSGMNRVGQHPADEVRTAPVPVITPPCTEQPALARADEQVEVEVDSPPRTENAGMPTAEPPSEQPAASHGAVHPVPARDSGDRTTGSSRTVLALGRTGSEEDSWIELGPLGIEMDIAGVLFAAYVTSGGSECSRVTGWVTATGDPPSLEGVAARDRLRGKPAKVRALLECRDDSRNWVTIDDRTDITLAIERRAPRDAVLVGLVHWWRLSMSSTPALAPNEVSALRFGISAVRRELRGHPLAVRVEDVIEACRVAEAAGVGLEQHLVAAGRCRSGDSGDVVVHPRVPDTNDSGEDAPFGDRIAG